VDVASFTLLGASAALAPVLGTVRVNVDVQVQELRVASLFTLSGNALSGDALAAPLAASLARSLAVAPAQVQAGEATAVNVRRRLLSRALTVPITIVGLGGDLTAARAAVAGLQSNVTLGWLAADLASAGVTAAAASPPRATAAVRVVVYGIGAPTVAADVAAALAEGTMATALATVGVHGAGPAQHAFVASPPPPPATPPSLAALAAQLDVLRAALLPPACDGASYLQYSAVPRGRVPAGSPPLGSWSCSPLAGSLIDGRVCRYDGQSAAVVCDVRTPPPVPQLCVRNNYAGLLWQDAADAWACVCNPFWQGPLCAAEALA
jgi:hypothetical protein